MNERSCCVSTPITALFAVTLDWRFVKMSQICHTSNLVCLLFDPTHSMLVHSSAAVVEF